MHNVVGVIGKRTGHYLGLAQLGPYLESLAPHKGIHVVNMVLHKNTKGGVFL